MLLYPVRVVLEVAQGCVQRLGFRPGERELAGGGGEGADVAAVQLGEPLGEPFLAMGAEHEFQQPGQVVQVLAGVVEAGDLGGFGECRPARFQIRTAPSPRTGSWRTWPAPRRRAPAAISVPNLAAGAKAAR
jgi:hypothetical protein